MPQTPPFSGVGLGRKLTDDELTRAIRLDLEAEMDAINLYSSHLNATDSREAKKVLEHVIKEEKEHATLFLGLIKKLDPDQAKEVETLEASMRQTFSPLISTRLLVEDGGTTSEIEKRCIADVSKKNTYGDTSDKERLSRAFAICRASLQKGHTMKKGHAELTKRGQKRSAAKAKSDDHDSKAGYFERLVKKARNE